MNKMRLSKFSKENKLFLKCCELANVPPTMRQASKFRNGKGLAFHKKGEGIRLGLIEKEVIV